MALALFSTVTKQTKCLPNKQYSNSVGINELSIYPSIYGLADMVLEE